MKLPTLLKALQKEEHKEFEKFLQSPFFKASEQYLKFFRCLCKHHPSFEVVRADLEVAYRHCFGQQSLTDSKLYNLLSGLGRQVEQYLAVKMVLDSDGKDESQLQRELLVKSLGQRNMGAYFRAEAQRLADDIGAQPIKELSDYHALGLLNYEVYFNPDTPKHLEHPPFLQMAMENHDVYYCVAKLHFVAEMKARERLYKEHYQPPPLLDAVMEHSSTPGILQEHPLLAIYHHLVKLYLEGVNEKGFRAMEALFHDKFDLLPCTDQQNVLQHLINCGIALGASDVDVNMELLSLYKTAIATGMLLHNNRVTHVTFANIVTLAAQCREYDYASGFIQTHAKHLDEHMRLATLSMSNAVLFYNQGKLKQSHESLVQEVFTTPPFDIGARSLMMRVLYDKYMVEGKDYEFLTAHLTSFEKYVSVKKFSAEKRKAQLNCIRFVRRMVAVKFKNLQVGEKEKDLLRVKLGQTHPMVIKKWLAEKIETL